MPQSLNARFGDFELTHDLETDVRVFLSKKDQGETFLHVQAVVTKAVELAEQFGGNTKQVKTAAWLHDLGTVIPTDELLEVAKALRLNVLPEEESNPFVIHQKVSASIAERIFGITDPVILSAVECHTTLKANASLGDKVVFVADKVARTHQAAPPYVRDMDVRLERSIDEAALVYLNYLYETLSALHPWAEEAREQLLKLTR